VTCLKNAAASSLSTCCGGGVFMSMDGSTVCCGGHVVAQSRSELRAGWWQHTWRQTIFRTSLPSSREPRTYLRWNKPHSFACSLVKTPFVSKSWGRPHEPIRGGIATPPRAYPIIWKRYACDRQSLSKTASIRRCTPSSPPGKDWSDPTPRRPGNRSAQTRGAKPDRPPPNVPKSR
jgi:hypothetical protein